MAPTMSPPTVTDAEVTRCTRVRIFADVARHVSTNVSGMPVWGTDVVEGNYAGHPGLLYEPRPHSFSELLESTDRWGERTFLVHGGRRISYAEFTSAVAVAGQRLRELSIERGDRVLLFAYNSPEWALALWALWMVGAVPVLGNR